MVAPVHAVTLYDGDHCVQVMHITVLVSALECGRLEMQAPSLPVVAQCACSKTACIPPSCWFLSRVVIVAWQRSGSFFTSGEWCVHAVIICV